MKKWESALLIALCITLLGGVRAQAKTQRLENSVIRLHVVAVSDDKTEQMIKLRVRDAILDYITPKLENCDDSMQAVSLIESEKASLREVAESVSSGRSVSVMFGREAHALRESEGIILPAGEYMTLRIVLGVGEGHNWWGVVFPQLGADGTAKTVMLVSDKPGVVVKFKVLEWVRRLWAR